MTLSYWEQSSWFSNIDFTIVGSGIVGLNAALHLKEKYPLARVLILERGILPTGASTKNAGFACFGSLSEILEDLNSQTENAVVSLVQRRIEGLNLLKKIIGEKAMDLRVFGGYEFFLKEDNEAHRSSISKIQHVNELLRPVFHEDVFSTCENKFKFKNIMQPMVFNKFEGQINTGRMMESLLHKVHTAGVKILNSVTVEEFVDNKTSVEVKTDKLEFYTKKLLIATNGFASKLGIEEVKPARAQVLITKPIKDLHIKGTFHLDKGYYYFRNIEDRILLGGGRNLNFKAEETTDMDLTTLVQERLEDLLKYTILPTTPFEIDQRWSGIMGVGKRKEPILKHLSENVVCGVRLGGMGIAIGSITGRDLAELVIDND